MPTSTAVKFFHSAMTGAPTLSGTAGSMIAVLDACLVNGFGTKTADSVVVAGGIATFNVSAGIGALEADTVVLVAGATPAGLNGEKRVITATATAITFDATGISNQTATGTITAKLAPAGWAKSFAGTNLAAYRSADITGTRAYLRIDDTATGNGRAVGYESMSDISTGVGAFPSATQVPGGLYWAKANAANATARAWTLIADGKTFYLHMHTGTSSPGISGCVFGFGDFVSYKSGDAYAAKITGFTNDLSTASTQAGADFSHATGTIVYAMRAYTGLGGSVSANSSVESYSPTTYSGGANATAVPAYPNGANNALILSRKLVYEPGSLRGIMRGAMYCPQNCQASFAWRDRVDGQDALLGRKLMVVKCSSPAGAGSSAALFFDVTGPWA